MRKHFANVNGEKEICGKILDIRKKYYYDNSKMWKRGKRVTDLKEEYEKTENVKFFITHSALSKFDFSNDCINEKYMQEDDPVRKYMLYRVSQYGCKITYPEAAKFQEDEKNIYSRVIDPDSGSILLQVLYEHLYDIQKYRDKFLFIKDRKEIGDYKKKENANIVGDTMNSLQSVLNSYMEHCIEKENDYFKGIRKKRKNVYGRVSFVYFLEIYCHSRQYKKRIVEELEKVNALELMKTYHTLGNFIIIPIGCNVPRGRCVLKDFWDLTLACIYNWYAEKEKKEDRIFRKLGNDCYEYNIGMILKSGSDLEKYIEWLKLFGTWDKFVEDNYLGDVIDEKKNVIENFVEMKNDRSYGQPKELWPGHFTGDIMPTKFEEYKDFFTNSSCYIKNRGAIMHEKLKERYK